MQDSPAGLAEAGVTDAGVTGVLEVVGVVVGGGSLTGRVQTRLQNQQPKVTVEMKKQAWPNRLGKFNWN